MNQITIEPLIEELKDVKKKLHTVQSERSALKKKIQYKDTLLSEYKNKQSGSVEKLDNLRTQIIEILQGVNYICLGTQDHGDIMITAVKLLDIDAFWFSCRYLALGEIVNILRTASKSDQDFLNLTLKHRGKNEL